MAWAHNTARSGPNGEIPVVDETGRVASAQPGEWHEASDEEYGLYIGYWHAKGDVEDGLPRTESFGLDYERWYDFFQKGGTDEFPG